MRAAKSLSQLLTTASACLRARWLLPGLALPGLFAAAAQAASQASDARIAPTVCESCDQGLSGDWGGRRRVLLERGIEVTLANTGDLLFIRRGDQHEGVTYTNLFEAGLAFDMARLADLPGGRAYILAVATHGDDPADVTGTLHAPSSVAAADAFRLLQAWYEQGLAGERLGILVGLYAVDSEFDAKETTEIFVAGGHGTGLDLSESGLNGPSIFPVTSFGTRVRFDITENVTARLALLDGVPGDPDDPTATASFHWSDEEGLLAIGEIDYAVGPEAQFKRFVLGAWHYTSEFDDLLDRKSDGSAVRRNGSGGIYAFAEGLLWREPGLADQGLSGVIRAGVADDDVNRIGAYYGAGLVYRGLIPGRDQDAVGIGFSVAVNGDKFKLASQLAGAPVTDRETELTLVYNARISRWLRLQPVVHYYLDPGTDPAADNVLVLGLRIAVSL